MENMQSDVGTFTDPRDGKVYKTVKIGNQVWMAENLDYDEKFLFFFSNGTSKCYGNNSRNAKKYGRLYTWYEAKKACPAGWHLPRKAEWDTLIETVGGEATAGKYLKSQSGWDSNGEDRFGFMALPGGLAGLDPFRGWTFSYAGEFGQWWSSSEHDADNAYYLLMNCDDDACFVTLNKWRYSFSVRCVKD